MRDGWDVVPLNQLLERSIGGVWGSEPGTDQVDVTVVRSTEFSNSGILMFGTGVIRSVKSSQLKSRELAEGDILLEKSGGGPEQPVGRVVYVDADIPRPTVCSNFIQLLSPKQDRVLPRFMFLVMWYWHHQKRTLEYQAQTTGIRNLRTQDYLGQSFPLPTLDEQKRIVDLVSSVDAYVQALSTSPSSLELTETTDALSSARRLRTALLSDLLSGRHEIPHSYDDFLRDK